MNRLPSVSVVIPSWNGASHLPDCLGSLDALDYPRELLEVIVVDNGSTDDSRSLVESRFPWVRVIGLDGNHGFAEASNEGARASSAECVAFLNNDMRVDPGWLRALAGGHDPANGYVCAAGVILDWTGERLDFAGGWIPFYGRAAQEHFGEPMSEDLVEDGRDLVFACGGSMLIGREVFLDLGGFDPTYFAFYEDVDLGWRLWLAGHKVRLAGGSRSFHRHHSTGSGIPLFRRMLLYERNALATLIKNVGDENLANVLAPSLLLLARRSSRASKSARDAFDLDSADDAGTETVKREGIAPVHAVAELLDDLPGLLERRGEVQARRRRSDEEIFALFGRPFASLSHEEGYLEASVTLRAMFGLDRVFTKQRPTRVLVVDDDHSERPAALAKYASTFSETSLVSPGRDEDVLSELLAESDLVIAPGRSAHAAAIAAQTRGLLVVDAAASEGDGDAELVRRADAVLTRADDHTPLRDLLRSDQPVSVPEDLQQLLRVWREHYKSGGRTKGAARTLIRWLPDPIERSVRRLLRRDSLAAP